MNSVKKKSVGDIVYEYRSVVILAFLAIVVSVISPAFLTVTNILNVLQQTSINAIIAAGMTFVILTAGIDLSVGSILAFSSAIFASLMTASMNTPIAIFVALAIGTMLGSISGFIIAKRNLQPFIVTLATMTLIRGLSMIYSDGRPINIDMGSELFEAIGEGATFGIPNPVIITCFVYIASYFILHHTKHGRYIYAVGGNENTAILSGIDVEKIKIMAYSISGLFSSIAAIIMTSRLASAQPTAGTGYELDAIAAVVLGGTTLMGGSGKIMGTLIGALIIGILSNALNLMDVSSYYQMIVKALVILFAVLIDKIR